MNPQYIKVFLKVVELKSLSGAANALYVSQSTISFQLTQLEKELNTQLLFRERGRRTVELTNAGRQFLPVAQQWHEAERLTESFKQSYQNNGLRIAASVNGFESLLFSVIEKLASKAPETKVGMIISEWEDVPNSIINSDADIAFCYGRLPDNPLLKQTLVLREDRCILCSANAAFEPGIIPASRLDPACEISIRNRRSSADYVPPAIQWVRDNLGGNTSPQLCVEKRALAPHFLKDPENWAIFPRSTALKLISQFSDTYSMREVTPKLPYRDCYMVEPKSSIRSATVAALLQCIKEYIAETSYLHLPEETV